MLPLRTVTEPPRTSGSNPAVLILTIPFLPLQTQGGTFPFGDFTAAYGDKEVGVLTFSPPVQFFPLADTENKQRPKEHQKESSCTGPNYDIEGQTFLCKKKIWLREGSWAEWSLCCYGPGPGLLHQTDERVPRGFPAP